MSAPGRPPGRPGTDTAWYVYGLVPAETSSSPLAELRGIGDTVSLVTDGRLGALVSMVPLSEFDEEPLAANLHDPTWLEIHVRRHDAVLGAVARDAPVIPFRFGTIYRGEDHVRAMLAEHPELTSAFETLRDRVELGVKGFLADAAGAPDGEEEAAVSAGRRYLEQKQEARRTAEAREELLGRAADESHARLLEAAEAGRANPLQPREASGRSADMFLNGAYLVGRSAEEEFRAAVATLEAELGPSGIAFEVTGPWPPYNFVEVE